MPDMSDGRILNPEQQAAASHYTGPALTLAGPGQREDDGADRKNAISRSRTCAPDRILSVTLRTQREKRCEAVIRKRPPNFCRNCGKRTRPRFKRFTASATACFGAMKCLPAFAAEESRGKKTKRRSFSGKSILKSTEKRRKRIY